MMLYKLRLLLKQLPPKLRWEPPEKYEGWLNGYAGESNLLFFQIHPSRKGTGYDLRCHLPNFVEYPFPSEHSIAWLKIGAQDMFNGWFTELIFGESR